MFLLCNNISDLKMVDKTQGVTISFTSDFETGEKFQKKSIDFYSPRTIVLVHESEDKIH